MQTVKNLVYKNENPYPFHTSVWGFNERLRAYWCTKTSLPVAQLSRSPANLSLTLLG